jgi:hypothetical protein
MSIRRVLVYRYGSVLRIGGERRTFHVAFTSSSSTAKIALVAQIWDSFKRNFPDRSGEQARSFVLLLIAAASIWLLSRIILATFWSGLPGPYSK